MRPAIETGVATVFHGDCLELLRADENGYPFDLGYGERRLFPDASIDAVVTDPPYGLEFMGKDWDSFKVDIRQSGDSNYQQPDNPYGRSKVRHGAARSYGGDNLGAMQSFQAWCEEWAAECLRVLKPGGHMLAFGGSRTWHRLAAAIEDAGFEIRDSIAWLYGSGFPKSMDVSKAIDLAAGVEREVVGYDAAKARPNKENFAKRTDRDPSAAAAEGWKDNGATITAPATDAAKQWDGWGTALKPAFEPIVVGRKPLIGTVVANVLAHGTGALNIDANRVEVNDADYAKNAAGDRGHAGTRTPEQDGATDISAGGGSAHDDGRHPTNVLIDESQADALDRQTGTLRSGANPTRRGSDKFRHAYGEFKGQTEIAAKRGADSGGASRFYPTFEMSEEDWEWHIEWQRKLNDLPTFRYEAKAPTYERPTVDGVQHPTVKPLALMRWLVRLVTPPGGKVLDMFAGSGTTIEAAVLEGFECVAMEREAEYIPLIDKRLAKPMQQSLFDDMEGAA